MTATNGSLMHERQGKGGRGRARSYNSNSCAASTIARRENRKSQ